MSEENRVHLQRGRRIRADVRQALLKSASAHLYPGIPPGEWQPAAVMADMVIALRTTPKLSVPTGLKYPSPVVCSSISQYRDVRPTLISVDRLRAAPV